MKAMLWQQSRQVASYCAAILVVNLFFAIIFGMANSWQQRNWTLAEFGPLVAGLSFVWLGCLAFYGDGVRRQCGFYADRGVSPTLVWFTRLLPVLTVATLLFVSWRWSFHARGVDSTGDRFIRIGLILGFASGQLMAIWLWRPTLSFFAAPVYAWAIIVFNAMLVIQYYPGYWWTLLLSLPVLSFASWRLTGRWLDGSIDSGFHWRAAAYSLVAISIPCFVVFSNRWATTPRALTQWRAEMMSHHEDVLKEKVSYVEVMPQARTSAYGVPGFSGFLDGPSFRKSLEDELKEIGTGNPARIGAFMAHANIYGYLDAMDQPALVAQESLPPDTPALAVKVLLHWARLIRTDCAESNLDLYTLWTVAEPAERNAVRCLSRLRRTNRLSEEMAALVDMIPDSNLRKASRQQALTREWHRYIERIASNEQNSQITRPVEFARVPTIGITALPFERTRAMRYMDVAVKKTLDYLDSSLLPASSPELRELSNLWYEGLSGPTTGAGYYHEIDPEEPVPWLGYWTSDHEQTIKDLRAAFPSE